jgi:catechol 2,3-dioxygenase-like lactoylglutathione lyase family enzyme
MLTTSRLVANVHVDDLDAAVEFYGTTLGLSLAERVEVVPGFEQVLFAVGDAQICISQEPGGGESTKTLVAFDVDDLEAEVADLRGRGVVIEEYDLPSIKTVDGVATIGPYKAAWFKDPQGNILGLSARIA